VYTDRFTFRYDVDHRAHHDEPSETSAATVPDISSSTLARHSNSSLPTSSSSSADRILGRLVKVTPSSKVVGDLALALVGAGVGADEFAADPSCLDIPESVIGFLRGELGDPPGGWPEPLRTKALAGRPPAKPTEALAAEDEAVLAQPGPKRQPALNRLLFPGPTRTSMLIASYTATRRG
jgi:pyruvate carboxylase